MTCIRNIRFSAIQFVFHKLEIRPFLTLLAAGLLKFLKSIGQTKFDSFLSLLTVLPCFALYSYIPLRLRVNIEIRS
jgi:hypothetical protein